MEFPVAALDEGNIAEPLRGDIAHPRAAPFQDGVGGDRGPQPQVADVGTQAFQPFQHPIRRVGGGGEILPDCDQPLIGIVGHKVRECSTDIDTDRQS